MIHSRRSRATTSLNAWLDAQRYQGAHPDVADYLLDTCLGYVPAVRSARC